MRALITGATSGIGQALARELSRRGWKLVLTGRNETALLSLKRELRTETHIIPLDLSERNAPFALYKFCKDKPVDLLINNAGFGIFGEFSETALDEELCLIDVNIRAVHILTKLFLRDFKRRNFGTILNVASSAGFMSGPLMSSYYASKNYVVRLSLAIHEELRRSRSAVKICVLCPGPVETNFNRRAGVRFTVPAADADEIARYTIDRTMRGQVIQIPKTAIKLAVLGAKLAPSRLVSAVAYEVQKKKLD